MSPHRRRNERICERSAARVSKSDHSLPAWIGLLYLALGLIAVWQLGRFLFY